MKKMYVLCLAVLVAFLAYSPTAMSAVPVTSGLVLQLDISDVNTTTRSGVTYVTSWTDQSGSSNNAVAPLDSNQPILVSNATPTGDSAVKFDGSGDYLSIAPNSTLDGGTWTMFVVHADGVQGTGAAGKRMINFGYADIDPCETITKAGTQVYQVAANSALGIRALGRSVTNSGVFVALTEVPDDYATDTFYVAAATFDSVSTNANAYLVDAAGTVYTGTGINASAVGQGNTIAFIGCGTTGMTSTTPGNFFNGSLCEVLVYNRVLSPAEIASVNAYLGDKYIPPIAYNPSPYNGEAGIDVNTILDWEAPSSYTPTGYNIYLDSSESAVQNATPSSSGLLHKDLNRTDTNSILSVVLDANTTYYWRVDSLNGSATITGGVWEFKTKFIYYMAGDINKDSTVDYLDLVYIADQWLYAGTNGSADIDKSQRVNFADYAIMTEQWNHLVKKDYFEADSSLPDWTVVDEGTKDAPSSWQISSGWLAQTTNIYGPDSSAVDNRKGTYAYWNEPEAFFWSDYKFEVSLKATDNDGIGVMFRYQDPANYYKFDMDRERNFRKLFKMYKGTETLLANVTVTPGYPTNTQMQVKVAIDGNQINILLDGVNVFGSAITDSDIDCGTVALYDWGTAAAYFDNFSIDVTRSTPVIARDDNYDIAYNQTLNVSSNGTLANDVAESGVLTATLVSSPQHGDITIFNANGTFTYVPDTSYIGQDSFVYEAATANGSDQATVTITVHSDLEFSIVLLPDVQNYYNYPDVFNTQTQWIADNKDEFNIAFVMTEGDFTNHNNVAEWSIPNTAMSFLDGEVPYAAVVGNHDTGSNMSTRDCSLFNQYFPASRFSSYLSGVYESNHMENSYHTFTAGGIDWLVFALEFGPRNKILDWANGIIAANPHRRVIIVTHNYMYYDDTRVGTGDTWNPHNYTACTSATGDEACNDGEEMWTNFVKLHENVSFVFSGHILSDGVGTLVSTGDNGNSVYQMLANYQDEPNGGNGWLRIVTFYPEQQKVGVKTYSPYLDSYNTAADQQFEFTGVDLTTP